MASPFPPNTSNQQQQQPQPINRNYQNVVVQNNNIIGGEAGLALPVILENGDQIQHRNNIVQQMMTTVPSLPPPSGHHHRQLPPAGMMEVGYQYRQGAVSSVQPLSCYMPAPFSVQQQVAAPPVSGVIRRLQSETHIPLDFALNQRIIPPNGLGLSAVTSTRGLGSERSVGEGFSGDWSSSHNVYNPALLNFSLRPHILGLLAAANNQQCLTNYQQQMNSLQPYMNTTYLQPSMKATYLSNIDPQTRNLPDHHAQVIPEQTHEVPFAGNHLVSNVQEYKSSSSSREPSSSTGAAVASTGWEFGGSTDNGGQIDLNQLLEQTEYSDRNPGPAAIVARDPAGQPDTSRAHVPELDDGKMLEDKSWTVALKKELKKCDVNPALGRVVLPKKYVETCFPPLVVKNGGTMKMKDINSLDIWEFKFKFWPNNKSKMYILEGTGNLIKKYQLKVGDYFIIYKENGGDQYMVTYERCHSHYSHEAPEEEIRETVIKRRRKSSSPQQDEAASIDRKHN